VQRGIEAVREWSRDTVIEHALGLLDLTESLFHYKTLLLGGFDLAVLLLGSCIFYAFVVSKEVIFVNHIFEVLFYLFQINERVLTRLRFNLMKVSLDVLLQNLNLIEPLLLVELSASGPSRLVIVVILN
jgi:hypothetical protein